MNSTNTPPPLSLSDPLLTLARQNFASLHCLSDFLRSRGYTGANRTLEEDTAQTVHDVFVSMAWSDRQLHAAECWLLDALLEEDGCYGRHLQQAIANQSASGGEEIRIPACVAAAALHDSMHHTQFREMIINHLENLAMLVVAADGHATESEMESFRHHFNWLRRIGAAPAASIK